MIILRILLIFYFVCFYDQKTDFFDTGSFTVDDFQITEIQFSEAEDGIMCYYLPKKENLRKEIFLAIMSFGMQTSLYIKINKRLRKLSESNTKNGLYRYSDGEVIIEMNILEKGRNDSSCDKIEKLEKGEFRITYIGQSKIIPYFSYCN